MAANAGRQSVKMCASAPATARARRSPPQAPRGKRTTAAQESESVSHCTITATRPDFAQPGRRKRRLRCPSPSEAVGSAHSTMASGSKPSPSTSANCKSSTIVIPSSNSPFAHFLLLRDLVAPGGRWCDTSPIGKRTGGQNACVGSEPTPGVAFRTKLPTQAQGWRGDLTPALPFRIGLVKLRGPVSQQAATHSDSVSEPVARPHLPILVGRFSCRSSRDAAVRSSGINHPAGPLRR